MFQAVIPPIVRSSKLYTQHQVFVMGEWNSPMLAQQIILTNTRCSVYSFELLMMGGKTA